MNAVVGAAHGEVERLPASAIEVVSDTDDETAAEEEDATAWRAGEASEDDDGELDSRVADAFDTLNLAIAENNEVEAAHTEALRKLQAQAVAAEEKLAPLSKAHAKQVRKLEKFRAEQSAAQEAAARLKQLTTDLSNAREALELQREALELQREGKAAAEADATKETALAAASSEQEERARMQQWQADLVTFREAEDQLEARRKHAAEEVKKLEAQRRRCAADAEKRAKRVVAHSAAVGDLAAEALPYLARQASLAALRRAAEAEVKEAGAATGKAKAHVKEAMGELERISLEIAQQQEQGSG